MFPPENTPATTGITSHKQIPVNQLDAVGGAEDAGKAHAQADEHCDDAHPPLPGADLLESDDNVYDREDQIKHDSRYQDDTAQCVIAVPVKIEVQVRQRKPPDKRGHGK